MQPIFFAIMLTAASPQFEARILGDQAIVGTLTELTAKRVTIATAAGPVALDTDKLIRLAPRLKPAAAPLEARAWIELADGSSFAARDYAVNGGRARFSLPGDQVVELPVAMIATVRLQPETEAMAGDWQRILAMKLDGDVLVARKGETLDYHKGVIRDVNEQAVQFVLDGEPLAVKRSKVYGLAYYHPADQQLPEPVGRLVDASGGTWSVRSLALSGGKLQWTTPAGLTIVRPLEAIGQIDFTGKIVYLSDLKPESVRWSPYFAMAKPLAVMEQFYTPRQDKSLESKPLQIGGTQYAKGLALHSRTEMVYRLPERFSRLKAVAGIDDAARPHGNVQLVIRGDDRVLLDVTVTGTDAPKPLDLDLTGVRRLNILVDFGDNSDVGDYLDLADALMVK